MKPSALALGMVLSVASATDAQNVPVKTGEYAPDWANLSKWECPEWYKDIKFGVWAHWDPQCQAADGDWYARGMYFKDSENYKWHKEHYGDPCVKDTEHGYKDLCNEWKAENWKPDSLVRLYHEMGARYFFAMGQHHDNFDCWDSPYQPWNSKNIGPKRDILGEWAAACKEHGMPLGVSMHGSHTWTWFEITQKYDGNMTKADGAGKWWDGYDPQDLYAQNHTPSPGWESDGTIGSQWDWGNDASLPSEEFKVKFRNRVLQCIDAYHPAMLYFDDTVLPFYGCDESIGLDILAHAYNTDPGMVVTGKILEDKHKEAMLWDVERGIPDRPQEKYWQTCTCIGSWHYSEKVYESGSYKSPQQVVDMLIDIVSKNGNLLLSIPVKGDGTLDDKEMGFIAGVKAWMDQNSRSIYGTRVWKSFGEGPLAEGSQSLNDQGFNEGNNYSSKDVRYVIKYAKTEEDADTLFASVLRWPEEGSFTFRHLGRASEYFPGEVKSIELLGYGPVECELGMEGLTVRLPESRVNDIAPVFALTFEPGTDKALSLQEFLDYCKEVVGEADDIVRPANTGSPDATALSDLVHSMSRAESSLGGSTDEQAEALSALHAAFNTYMASTTAAGAPLYEGEDLTVEKLVQADDFDRTPETDNGKRFGEPAHWTVTDFNIPNGDDGVKQGIDGYGGTEALMLGVYDDRGNADDGCDLAQAAIRRTVHLASGIYYFGATFNKIYQLSNDAYMYACAGTAEDLPTAEIPAKAIAWAHLNAAQENSDLWGITFIVEEEQDVTLGFQADLTAGSAEQEVRVKSVHLRRYDEGKIATGRDVTLQYLVERSDFSRLDESVTTRFATPKYWTVENFKIPNGDNGTKNGIDKDPGFDCLMLGIWVDRELNEEGDLSDARIYRKLSLEPGTYSMQVHYQHHWNMTPKAYLFASTEILGTSAIPGKALAYVRINEADGEGNEWQTIVFSVDEAQDVYVGWQADLNDGNDAQEFRVRDVRLLYLPKQTGDAVRSTRSLRSKTSGTHYYNLNGQELNGAPSRGLYIEDGRKVLKR